MSRLGYYYKRHKEVGEGTKWIFNNAGEGKAYILKLDPANNEYMNVLQVVDDVELPKTKWYINFVLAALNSYTEFDLAKRTELNVLRKENEMLKLKLEFLHDQSRPT